MDEAEAEILLGLKPKPGTLVPVKSGKVPAAPFICSCRTALTTALAGRRLLDRCILHAAC